MKMVYYVTGSNLFGQWNDGDLIINKFIAITESNLKLLQINWSYNILQNAANFYKSGFCEDKVSQLNKIPIPEDYSGTKEDLTVAGNDYNLILVSKNSSIIWVTDLTMKKGFKKICINTEEPIENIEKRSRKDNSVDKIMFLNDNCLFLTSIGHVYHGILPSYLDTGHCRGKVCDVCCGYEHNLLLTDAGIVYTWGNGRRLQLGHGDVSTLEVPTEVEALAGIKITKISCGGWHSLALSEFGDLYSWGWNDTGQLGIKHKKEEQSYPVPTLVDLFDDNGEDVTLNVKDIACGSRHSAILLEDNSVWTSGCNKYGQLGFSEVKFPSVNVFKKAFQCDYDCKLICGAWTTVIDSSQ